MSKDPIDDKEVWEAFKRESESSQPAQIEDDTWIEFRKTVQKLPFKKDRREDPLPVIKLSSLRPPHMSSQSLGHILDLHGFTQDQAYEALRHFLQLSTMGGLKHVLIITGKGKNILRSLVPRWLKEEPFAFYISHTEQAPLHKGGSGALIVHLKRTS